MIKDRKKRALVIEATALAEITSNKKLEYCFITVAKTMEAVISC